MLPQADPLGHLATACGTSRGSGFAAGPVSRARRTAWRADVAVFDPAAKLQHPTGDGLPRWTAANRSIENTEVVVWYVFGHNHVPRLEDWPVMPVASIGFQLKPDGFFHRNPALDVPLPERACQHAEGS